MHDRKHHLQDVLISYENDLLTLISYILHDSKTRSRIRYITKVIHQICSVQAPSPAYLSTDPGYHEEKSLRDLYKHLYILLAENNHYLTWFTKIVDRYCYHDQELKRRLNNFIQRIMGPVIKLSLSETNQNTALAIEFPHQEMRDIFLEQLGINHFHLNDTLIVDETIVYFPAFLAKNQQLGITFPTVDIKNNFINMLNLVKANLIFSNHNDCHLYINDRRIQDTASKFHIAVICPYFSEYYKVKYAARLLSQALRDGNSFFSQYKIPKELLLTIAAEVSSSDAINVEEKMRIANYNFPR